MDYHIESVIAYEQDGKYQVYVVKGKVKKKLFDVKGDFFRILAKVNAKGYDYCGSTKSGGKDVHIFSRQVAGKGQDDEE